MPQPHDRSRRPALRARRPARSTRRRSRPHGRYTTDSAAAAHPVAESRRRPRTRRRWPRVPDSPVLEAIGPQLTADDAQPDRVPPGHRGLAADPPHLRPGGPGRPDPRQRRAVHRASRSPVATSRRSSPPRPAGPVRGGAGAGGRRLSGAARWDAPTCSGPTSPPGSRCRSPGRVGPVRSVPTPRGAEACRPSWPAAARPRRPRADQAHDATPARWRRPRHPGPGSPGSRSCLAASSWRCSRRGRSLTPILVGRRRRRIADPSIATVTAWTAVADELVDRTTPASVATHTPTEVVRPVSRASSRSASPASWADWPPSWTVPATAARRRSDDDADAGMGVRRRRRGPTRPSLVGTVRPAGAPPAAGWRRLRSTVGVDRRAEPWHAELPDTALISSSDAPGDIPDVSIEARIGDGATGTVYRGVHVPSGRAVAVKVFRYGPADPGFDDNRFDWEVRIAREVSGLPNLPEVLAAGITPTSGRPYLVSTLYDGRDAPRPGAPGRPDDHRRGHRASAPTSPPPSSPCTSSASSTPT